MRRRHLTSVVVTVVGLVVPLATGAWATSAGAVEPAVAGVPATATSGMTPTSVQKPAAATAAAIRRNDLPVGWTATRTADGRFTLTWAASTALPVTDAGLAVYAGATRLGRADVRGKSASITVAALPTALSKLQVRAGRVTAAKASATLAASPAGRPGYHPRLSSSSVPAPTLPADLWSRRAVPITSTDYTLPALTVPGYRIPLQMSGHVVAPVKTASSARPVVVFLHGRHAWCYGGTDTTDWTYPCSGKSKPIPSMLGYDYAQRALAARGYVTLSVDLNGVNAQDGDIDDGGAAARSAVVRRHLVAVAGWQASPGTAPAGFGSTVAWDLSKVVLIGHSRGGEGADRAAVDVNLADPFRIAGLVLWAPVNFARQTAAATPTVTLLPGCDGDVSDLQGQVYTDRALDAGAGAALHSSVYIPGANHNFLNTEWTPGIAVAPSFDDGEWTPCPKTARPTPAQERSAGAAYTLAAVRAVIDRNVTAARYIDGSATLATGVGAARAMAVPVGGDRQLLWRGNAAGTPAATLKSGAVCVGRVERRECPGALDFPVSPHWLTWDARTAPSAVLTYAAAGSSAGVTWATPVDVSGSAYLEARVVVPPQSQTSWRVRLTDSLGRSARLIPDVGSQLLGLPNGKVTDDAMGRYFGQLVRVPLAGASGVDLTRLKTVDLVSMNASRVVTLLDVSSSRLGAGAPAPANPLPRVDFTTTSMSIAEGSANRVLQMTLGLNRPLGAPVDVVVYREVFGGDPQPLSTITIPAGVSSVQVPLPVVGNTLDDPDEVDYSLAVEPHGLLGVGEGSALVTVKDDDPLPTLTVTPALATTAEGGSLTWTLTLNTRSNRFVELYLEAVATPSELRGGDLPTAAREAWGATDATKVLSSYPASQFVDIPTGATSVKVSLPVRRDGVKEGTERARFTVVTEQAVVPSSTVLVGSVRD